MPKIEPSSEGETKADRRLIPFEHHFIIQFYRIL